jgi:hypothetical protein
MKHLFKLALVCLLIVTTTACSSDDSNDNAAAGSGTVSFNVQTTSDRNATVISRINDFTTTEESASFPYNLSYDDVPFPQNTVIQLTYTDFNDTEVGPNGEEDNNPFEVALTISVDGNVVKMTSFTVLPSDTTDPSISFSL